MSSNYDIARTPLSSAISRQILKKLRDRIKTGLPAIVKDNKNYESTQTLDVELVIEDILDEKGKLQIENVILYDKFVRLQHGNGFHIKLPVAIGDEVLVKWGSKDLEDYFASDGKTKIPQSHHMLPDLDDCWIELGFGTPQNNSSPSKTNLVIEGDNTVITITPSGDITTTTSGNINCTAQGNYNITASHLTINNDVTIKNDLLVEGNTTTNGVTTSKGQLIGESGTFSSSYAGLMGGGMTVNVDMNVTGSVVINGIVIESHTHIDSQGGRTGAPQ